MSYAKKLDRAEIAGLSIQENKTRGLGPKRFGIELYLTKKGVAVSAKELKSIYYSCTRHPGDLTNSKFLETEV